MWLIYILILFNQAVTRYLSVPLSYVCDHCHFEKIKDQKEKEVIMLSVLDIVCDIVSFSM